MRVLVIAGGALSSLAIVRSLASKGITTLTADVTKITGSAWSRYSSKILVYEAPSFFEPGERKFIESVFALVEDNDIDVLFPVNDPTVVPISKYRDRFLDSGIKVPIPPFEAVEIAFDKSKTYDFCSRLGLPQPKTVSLNDVDDVEVDFGLPCVIKRRSEAISGESVRYPRNRQELDHFLSNLQNKQEFLVQELIPGRSNVYSVVTVFDQGTLKAAITLRKLRENPPSGGVCVFGISVDEPEIQEYGVKILKELNWHGTATVEIKLDPRDNTPKLMEINPRFPGYVQLAIAAGVDIPYILYKIAVGEKVAPVTEYKVGVKWLRPYDDVWSLISALREASSLSERTGLLSSFVQSYLKTGGSSEFLQLSDPLPLFGQILYHYVVQPIRWRLARLRS